MASVMSNQLCANERTVNHPLDASWIRTLQFSRQRCIRKVLIADWACEAEDCACADRSSACIGARWEWAAMHHRMAYFNASRVAVHKDAAHLTFEHANQITGRSKIFRSAV